MTIYCPHCCKKNEYSYKKPETCSKCGKGFSMVAASRPTSKRVEERIPASQKIEEEDDFDLIDNDGFYDKSYREGKFSKFAAASRDFRRGCVSVEVDKSESVKIGDILQKAGINKNGESSQQ